ncbi:MAG: ATP-binding protein [Salinisphaeraceae bacterium]
MKIKSISINRFRGYEQPVTIQVGDLLSIVGKNDIGKSTILEALDIFFNESKGCVKLDKGDINKTCLERGEDCIEISVEFIDLPATLVLDAANETTLGNEYLLTQDNTLHVLKRYPSAGKEKVYIRALHPAAAGCNDLLSTKIRDLQRIVSDAGLYCPDRTKSAELRKAIWDSSPDLQLQECEIEVAKIDAKNIWEQLKGHMPLFTLFQSDRKNSDGDSEVQDPMSLAVKEIIADPAIQSQLSDVARTVKARLDEVASRTLDKLGTFNSEIATSLNPLLPENAELKWADVFKRVAISGENDVPINKRGSGVKRLVLVSFFMAEAERRQTEQSLPDIIYAIEEPETSQHPNHQRHLIDALLELSRAANTQVLITTHSPEVVKRLKFDNILLISGRGEGQIYNVERNKLPYPSLNEISYSAFGECSFEYHNELYGFIEAEERLQEFKSGKDTRAYNKVKRDGSIVTQQITLTEFIRHQIHHPENTENDRFSFDELNESIGAMREFIQRDVVE